MKTMTLVAAMGLTSALLSLDVAAKPGRPDALTRGISVNLAAPVETAAAKRIAVQIGRPEALTRGLRENVETHVSGITDRLSPEQKLGRPEYHTRGIYCPHRGKGT
jgi:hypothetical protein